ncbi:Putative acetolactate synthase large subunit IlvX [Variovorax sp. PBS-H4]|uniref:acetolactate synthase large subunit n=1 Tax=Variovorax sp. PBS-H4 TaxID=434008 RepID=UPI001316338A|nr:acetolactate synthase large subunit [Variovorax sp. PBS-H4]VTU28625.1 Putative acetolactate synthase large subunit IlvX [Variovorax sp. PBS-H4]
MNGARSLVHTLRAAGIELCFANPGTSEMHFVAALDETDGIQSVLGLQENVVTGMADGYYRIAGIPACTLLHCGPGLANGLGNLHNARRARSGIVNVVGDQATHHRPLDAPLTADTDSLARTVSSWVRTSSDARHVGHDAAAAVQAARTKPGQIATLILPSDVSWNEGGVVAEVLRSPAPPPVDPFAIQKVAQTLRCGSRVLILLDGQGTGARSQKLAWRIAKATDASVMVSYGVSHFPRGRDSIPLERIPYVSAQATQVLSEFEHIVLVNSSAPVSFFAHPGRPSTLYRPETQVHVLTRFDQDSDEALQALADELGAREVGFPNVGPRPVPASGAPTPEGLAQTIAALMPDNAIVSDESVSYGRSFYQYTHAAAPHEWLHLTGGAIGDGLPVATGAAIGAGRRRRVISLQADGSAMYSLQSLWTQARERLPITTVLLNNRKYSILIEEYKNVGAKLGTTAMNMLDLGNPSLDWVKIANGLGVEAAKATNLEQLADLLNQSFKDPGPFLIELMV